jgi:transcriptional regulator with XRE-family HTH domain
VINERRAFGERLRRQREKQNITLNQIAASTKVAASLFAGLEKGDCSRWPGGMYNRAFIRGYAAAIRVDPDDVAAEFAEYYTASAETSPAHGHAVPAQATSATGPFALRLKLEVDPEELRRRAARRIVLAAADVFVVALIASIVAFASGIPYWSALAIFSIAYQVAVRLLSGLSPAERLLARGHRRNQGRLEEEHDDEAPVAGPASTIA